MLSDVKIDVLIQYKTDIYIHKSDYSTLKNQCLNLQPLTEVIKEINSQLSDIVEKDKKQIFSQLVKKACAEQVEQDKTERAHDIKEQAQDSLEESRLKIELESNLRKISSLEPEIIKDEENISRIKIILEELRRKIQTYNHIHEHPLNGTTHQHNETNHGHAHKETTHVHTHNQTTHTHNQSVTIHGATENVLEKRLLEEQRDLLVKNLKLQNEILKDKELEYKNLRSRNIEINNTLGCVLPEKALYRQRCELDRKKREQAQTSDLQDQLSVDNYYILKKNISSAHKKIDQHQLQLMEKVSATSYTVYLARLESFLQSQVILNYSEVNALKQIINHMRDYLGIKATQAIEEQKLRQATHNFDDLGENLRFNTEKLKQLKSSSPLLDSENQQLEQQNRELARIIQERQNLRNNLLKGGGLTLLLTGGGIGGVFLVINLMTIMVGLIPFLFIPAGLAGLTTLGLFLASLILTVQNSLDSNQINTNESTITKNTETISSQNQEAISLETEIIPSINTQIGKNGLEITLIKKNIEGLKEQAVLILTKANQVNPVAAYETNYFFNPPFSPDFTNTIPSAPLIHEGENPTNEYEIRCS